MVGDFWTKSNQGALFIKNSDLIMDKEKPMKSKARESSSQT